MTTVLGAAQADLWAWHPHPDVWLLVLGLGAAYPWALRRLRPPRARSTRRQAVLFYAGLVSLWLGADWPVHDVAEDFLLSVHMVQHLLFTLVAPPLMLMGTPPWLLRRLVAPVAGPLRRLTHPVVASVLFNGAVVVTHWPALVDAALRSEVVHLAVHVVLVGTAVVMWLPVLSTVPEVRRMSDPARMLYLFLQSIVPTVPASFLTFAEGAVYRFYAEAPRVGISVVADQQLAGAVMKIVGGLLLWATIVTIFFRWYQREQRDRVADLLTWADVEAELAATSDKAPQEA